MKFLDYASTLRPRTRMIVYVDDMGIEAIAPDRMVVEAVAMVLRYLVVVISQLHTQLLGTKCACCASSFRISRALACSVPGLAMRF